MHAPKKGVYAASSAVVAFLSPVGEDPPPTPNSIQCTSLPAQAGRHGSQGCATRLPCLFYATIVPAAS